MAPEGTCPRSSTHRLTVALAILASLALSTACSETTMSSLGPPPGNTMMIDGRSMHMRCSGAGSPTVILEAGIGSTSLQWSLVQREVSAFTRVCSYDRPGTGWSDATSVPRDAEHVADELAKLLATAGEAPPYVVVGHSLGGTFARVFASRQVDHVVALVLVDPSPVAMKPGWFDQVSASVLVEAMPLLRGFGIQPLRGQMAPHSGDLPPAVLSQMLATYDNPAQIRAFRDEFRATPSSSKQAEASVLSASLPVSVLSAGEPLSQQQAAMVGELQREHARLAASFTAGRHRIVDGSNHLTLVTAERYAKEIVAEIRLMVKS